MLLINDQTCTSRSAENCEGPNCEGANCRVELQHLLHIWPLLSFFLFFPYSLGPGAMTQSHHERLRQCRPHMLPKKNISVQMHNGVLQQARFKSLTHQRQRHTICKAAVCTITAMSNSPWSCCDLHLPVATHERCAVGW